MLARGLCASLQGLEARPVVVYLAPGLPGIQLVGLPDKAIQESRERVRSALRNSGFRGPLVRVVINLAPADLRKEGPSFDLPIALALLVASGQLARPQLEGLWCARAQTLNRLAGNHQYMDRCLGGDIPKGQALLIAVDLITRDLATKDLPEDRVVCHGPRKGRKSGTGVTAGA